MVETDMERREAAKAEAHQLYAQKLAQLNAERKKYEPDTHCPTMLRAAAHYNALLVLRTPPYAAYHSDAQQKDIEVALWKACETIAYIAAVTHNLEAEHTAKVCRDDEERAYKS